MLQKTSLTTDNIAQHKPQVDGKAQCEADCVGHSACQLACLQSKTDLETGRESSNSQAEAKTVKTEEERMRKRDTADIWTANESEGKKPSGTKLRGDTKWARIKGGKGAFNIFTRVVRVKSEKKSQGAGIKCVLA